MASAGRKPLSADRKLPPRRNVRAHKAIWEQIDAAAKLRGMSWNDMTREILRDWADGTRAKVENLDQRLLRVERLVDRLGDTGEG